MRNRPVREYGANGKCIARGSLQAAEEKVKRGVKLLGGAGSKLLSGSTRDSKLTMCAVRNYDLKRGLLEVRSDSNVIR
jgi:hypothetical protein